MQAAQRRSWSEFSNRLLVTTTIIETAFTQVNCNCPKLVQLQSIYSEEVNALTFFPISHLESLSSTAFPETGNESTEIGQWMKSITTKFS